MLTHWPLPTPSVQTKYAIFSIVFPPWVLSLISHGNHRTHEEMLWCDQWSHAQHMAHFPRCLLPGFCVNSKTIFSFLPSSKLMLRWNPFIKDRLFIQRHKQLIDSVWLKPQNNHFYSVHSEPQGGAQTCRRAAWGLFTGSQVSHWGQSVTGWDWPGRSPSAGPGR